jgi:hypothetical protein
MWYALSLFCISHLITLCHFSSRFRGTKQTRGLKEDHIAAKDWLNTKAHQQAEECNTSGIRLLVKNNQPPPQLLKNLDKRQRIQMGKKNKGKIQTNDVVFIKPILYFASSNVLSLFTPKNSSRIETEAKNSNGIKNQR